MSTIGEIAESVLNEVKAQNLVKLAQREIVSTDSNRQDMKTPVGKALLKLAAEIRKVSSTITEDDLEHFLSEVGRAG